MVSKKKKAVENTEIITTSPVKKLKSSPIKASASTSGAPPSSRSSNALSLNSSHARRKNPVNTKTNVDDDENQDFDESDEDVGDIDIVDGVKVSIKKSKKRDPEIDWSELDLMELIERMEHAIPPKDALKLESRVQKLDWNEVCFGDHTPEECKEVWTSIQLRLRRFRLLREVLEDAKEWVTKPWTNFYRSSKGNRHPDLPKRPLSTYMLFYMEKKDMVAKDNPGLEMTGVSKVIAEMYKNLSDKRKQKYTEMAAEERKVYEIKMEQFYRDHPNQVPKPSSSKESKSSRVTTSGPQKPSAPFKRFCNDKMRKHKDDPDFDKAAFLIRCKDQWRLLSDKKKAEYINRVMEDENKYQDELRSYMTDNPDFVPMISKSVLTKEEKSIIEKVAGKPEKPPNSGYSLFSRLMLVSEEIKQTPPKERMVQISQLWKNMNAGDQKSYKDQVTHLLDQYKLEYATYLESLSEEKRAEELKKNQPKRKPVKNNDAQITPNSQHKGASSKHIKKSASAREEKDIGTNQSHALPKPNNLYKNEPPQPPVNISFLYLEYFMKSAVHIPLKQREKAASQAWKDVPESERVKLRKELEDRKAQYIKNFEKFLKSLSQEELKEYSLLKASVKTNSELSEDSGSESDSSSSSQSDSGSSHSGSDSDC